MDEANSMNIQDAVIRVLKEAGIPLHSKVIAKRIIESGLWKSDGKTPEATISARLYVEIKENGEKSIFVKTAPKTFSLRDAQPVATVRHVSSIDSKREADSTDSKMTFSFLDAAEKVLDQFGNRSPIHYGNITKLALEQKWLLTHGKTPEATMNAQLVTEIKRNKVSGEPGRFLRTSPGCYSLVKWNGVGLSYEIYKHNHEIKKKLLAQLMDLTPTRFEELVGQLLAEMGFESIEVTKHSGDGGIDVRGTLLISDVVRIKMAVQAKRWKRKVHSPIVQQVRGSLGVHEQGMIITTSDFSAGAIKEAKEQDKTPVALMNGEQLVTLLMNYNLGVRCSSHDVFELKDLPIIDPQ